MSAEEHTPESTAPDTEPPQPGAMLKTARESAKLSKEYVAEEMRMTVSKVRALEADDYERLHSDIFIRGYLRTYAKLLNVDPDVILEAYQENRRAAGLDERAEESPLQINVPAQNRPLWKFVLWILLLLAGIWALSVWFLGNRQTAPEPVSFEPVTEAPISTTTASAAQPVAGAQSSEPLAASAQASFDDEATPNAPSADREPSADNETSTVNEPSAAESLASAMLPPAEPAAEAEPTASLDELRLRFADECWVEVTDSRGDVLETNLFQAGHNLTLNGEAPFRVKLGNSSAVSIVLNGDAFAFDPPPNGRLMTLTVSENP